MTHPLYINQQSFNSMHSVLFHFHLLVLFCCCYCCCYYYRMTSELHDFKYPNSAEQYPRHQGEAGIILQCALAFLGLYYIVLRAGKLLPPPSPTSLRQFDETGLQCRFRALVGSWREYENMQ